MSTSVIDGAGAAYPVAFSMKLTKRNRPFYVPDRLPERPAGSALATVTLPQWVKWSPPFRTYDMSQLRDRARVYELVMTEGGPADISRYVDAALLVEVWPQLVLRAEIRAAWTPVVEAWQEAPA